MDYMEKAQELEEGPTLLDSFLLYMDALGTEAAVSGSHEAVEARFQSFRSAWEQAREVSGLSDPSIPTSVFSDLVVAGLPVDEDGEGELASLIFTGSAFQYFLSIQGIF
ncbi:MAG: hypothetical protein ACRDH1_08415, partial [Actinomycetota bacterium]